MKPALKLFEKEATMPAIKAPAKDFRAIIQATFPDYKRRHVYIHVATEVKFHDLNWGGGSRAEYRACTVDGRGIPTKHDMGGPAPWENPFEGRVVELPADVVIVEGGIFCGKVAPLAIWVNPVNMPALLVDADKECGLEIGMKG